MSLLHVRPGKRLIHFVLLMLQVGQEERGLEDILRFFNAEIAMKIV